MATIVRTVPRIDEDPVDIFHLLHGTCYELAVAISEGTGWPIIGLIHNGEITHAAVRGPDGKLYDGRGIFDESLFGEPFNVKAPFNTREVTRVELEKTRPLSDLAICMARRLTEEKWPNLPWRQTELTRKVIAFVDDLEKLSRQHGFWLRAPYVTGRAIISPTGKDEVGYLVEIHEDGRTHTIDRILKNQIVS